MTTYLIRSACLFLATAIGIANVNSGVCYYEVESGRLKARTVDVKTTEKPLCEIPERLKDRWTLVGRAREGMRLRDNTVFVKYGVNQKLQYKCEESKGNTLLLSVTNYLGARYGVLCLGFAAIHDNPAAEYSVIRLNGHGPEHNLLSPQIIEEPRNPFPTLNATCVIRGSNRDEFAKMRRTERRCFFPDELRRIWNTTYHSARHVTIARKTYTLDLFTGDLHRFDCNVKEGDIYVVRSIRFSSEDYDGIMCLNITYLPDDPFYKYEVSRLNSGDEMEGQVKLIPSTKMASLSEDCDWLDSPARPEYLYS